ncbi:MAG: hypothetical protein ACRC68_15965 [Clostridium sp.]
MKKILIILVILSSLLISGCAQSKGFTISDKEFTDEQYEILALTGNRAFRYDLKNLPNDKSFELKIVYEVYKNKEKVKEESLLGMAYVITDEKIEDTNIAINIQENKIRLISGGAYSSIDLEEDISKLNNYYFSL